MNGIDEQRRKGRTGQASAMLLSLLFSVWLAVGGIAGPSSPSTTEIQRAAPSKAVVVSAGSGKQAQQTRTPDPAADLPPVAGTVLAELRRYPSDVAAARGAAPLSSAKAAPYQARAPPAI